MINRLNLDTIQGIIFDMDGILINVSKSYLEAIRQTAGYFLNREIKMVEVSKIKNEIGMNDDWDATYALINNPNISYEKIKSYFQSLYLGNKNKKGLINNERLIVPVHKLRLLKSKYRKLAIATGRMKAEAEYAIKKNRLQGIFDCIVTKEDVSKGKPAPDILLLTMQEMGLRKAVYIGDGPSDVEAAKSAGIPSIYVGNLDIGTIRFTSPLQVFKYLL